MKALMGTVILAACMVMLMPLLMAQDYGTEDGQDINTQETTTESTATNATDEQEMTSGQLQIRQLGESINDLIFRVKLFFTADEEKTLNLIQDREVELIERQQSWMAIKERITTNSDNLPEEERQEILAEINEEHEALVEEHAKIMLELEELKEENPDQVIAPQIDEAVIQIDQSIVAQGLNADIDVPDFIVEGEITQERAREIVRDEFGINADAAQVEERAVDGERTFVLTGEDIQTIDGAVFERNYEIWVSEETGTITFTDIDVHLGNEETPEETNTTNSDTTDSDITNNDIQTSENVPQAEIDGDISSQAQGTLDQLIDGLGDDQEVTLELEMRKEAGQIVMDDNTQGLTPEQEETWSRFQDQLRTELENSPDENAEVEINFRHSQGSTAQTQSSTQTSGDGSSASSRSSASNSGGY